MLSVGFRSETSCIKYKIPHLAKPRLGMTEFINVKLTLYRSLLIKFFHPNSLFFLHHFTLHIQTQIP
jgi:hypothetical protein